MSGDLRELASLDRLIHEPARLMIVALLAGARRADFLFLARETGLTRGNLSAHLSRLEVAGYVEVEKTFRAKTPVTVCRLTPTGRAAFAAYRRQLQAVIGAPHRAGQPDRAPGSVTHRAAPPQPA